MLLSGFDLPGSCVPRVGGEPEGTPRPAPSSGAGDGVPATGVTGLGVERAAWNPWL